MRHESALICLHSTKNEQISSWCYTNRELKMPPPVLQLMMAWPCAGKHKSIFVGGSGQIFLITAPKTRQIILVVVIHNSGCWPTFLTILVEFFHQGLIDGRLVSLVTAVQGLLGLAVMGSNAKWTQLAQWMWSYFQLHIYIYVYKLSVPRFLQLLW